MPFPEMRRSKAKPKYRLPSSRQTPDPWRWVLLGIVGIGVMWLVWQFIRIPDKKALVSSITKRHKSAKPSANGAKVSEQFRSAKSNSAAPVALAGLPHTNGSTLRQDEQRRSVAQATNSIASQEAPAPDAVPERVPAIPEVDPNTYPRPARDLFEAQIALVRNGICPGLIDGAPGEQTRVALRAFQRRVGLPATGELNPATRMALSLGAPPLRTRELSSADFARLQPLSPTWLGKSQQLRLDYVSIGELLCEEGRCSLNLLRKLNENLDWSQLHAGDAIILPAAEPPAAERKAAYVLIQLAQRTLLVMDDKDHMMAQFPCSIAKRVEKRPVGKLSVEVIIPNPDYTFDPRIFSESAEARALGRKLVIPPGPNNPVGMAWIGLNRSGYGIHGTPQPEQVGRTESHGCFRLANWNAEYLVKLAWVGMPVIVQ